MMLQVRPEPSLLDVARGWGRIGATGFGGPPAHIALLRRLVVEERRWVGADAFEDGLAAANLLPGPASTQLAILTAWMVRGPAGALVGGLAFILPGLLVILALAGVFLGDPPDWLLGAGAGAGAAVAAVAVRAGADLAAPALARVTDRRRWLAYAAVGAAAAVAVGPFLVLVLLVCGAAEVLRRGLATQRDRLRALSPLPAALLVLAAAGGAGSVAWTALKAGALSYGGGFVIVPLMRGDAVGPGGWMDGSEFLNAVALGQVTPGPVLHTVAVVGYAASGLGGALLATVVAFAPSFVFVLAGASRFHRLRRAPRVRAFLDGAGPAAAGAILGAAVLLALELEEAWQAAVLGAALVALLPLRRGVVLTLVTAGAIGAALVLAGVPIPR